MVVSLGYGDIPAPGILEQQTHKTYRIPKGSPQSYYYLKDCKSKDPTDCLSKRCNKKFNTETKHKSAATICCHQCGGSVLPPLAPAKPEELGGRLPGAPSPAPGL